MNIVNINQIQDRIIADFSFFDDWEDKYNLLIDFGKTLEPIPSDLKVDENRVKGCQSQVWVVGKPNKNGLVEYVADSDSVITKGLIAMLLKVLNNQPAENIANADLYFIEKIGMNEHLSPNRSNGLAQMVKKLKLLAIAFANNTNE